jgi:hypothetical protein
MENYTDTQMGHDMSALDDLINRRYEELRAKAAQLRNTNSTQSDAAASDSPARHSEPQGEPSDINTSTQSDTAERPHKRT